MYCTVAVIKIEPYLLETGAIPLFLSIRFSVSQIVDEITNLQINILEKFFYRQYLIARKKNKEIKNYVIVKSISTKKYKMYVN